MNWPEIENKIDRRIDLTEQDVIDLLALESPSDLDHMYGIANRLNLALNGDRVSFIHNMNLNYTNICEYHCTFCEFKKDRGSKAAYILSFEEAKSLIEATDGEISEITYQGGLSPTVKFEDALQLMRKIHDHYPHIHFHAFSPEEIAYYAHECGTTYEKLIRDCQGAGMGSMCGTAAEILDDDIRRKICSEKVGGLEWCEIIKTGHRLGMYSTATILFGHIEQPVHIANHFRMIREIQRETGRITEFIPLLFMPDKTKLGRAVNPQLDRLTYAYKMIAVSRLYFMNDIRNIQTSWVKLGWENALHSLTLGANDMSGTLYHESITRDAGGQNGEFMPRERFVKDILRVGKIPVERDTLYGYQRNSMREQAPSLAQN